jgi:hypothetical protein
MATTEREDASGAQEGRASIAVAMRKAATQLAELLGAEPDSVSAVRAGGEGWTANVEVVELERVPDSTSVMATYRVEMDARGDLLGYERTHRYARGQIDRR